MGRHGYDQTADRAEGLDAEMCFCFLALWFDHLVTEAHPTVINRMHLTDSTPLRDDSSYDVGLWHPLTGHQFHEIKSKYPARNGCYGLEDDPPQGAGRFTKLTVIADAHPSAYVLYTIWDKFYEQWVTANVRDLHHAIDIGSARVGQFPTYVGDHWRKVAGWYFPSKLFTPISLKPI